MVLAMCLPLMAQAQNIELEDILNYRSVTPDRYVENLEISSIQDAMKEKVFNIYRNNEKAKDRAVFMCNNKGYTTILYKGKFFFIRDYNHDKISEVVKDELQKKINVGSHDLRKAKNDFEKEDDLVADYKQKLKQDKAIDPVNGGHRHEIENALDLHQLRLKGAKERYEEATQKCEDIKKECALLYKELDIIIGKYYSIRDKREDNKGFACII